MRQRRYLWLGLACNLLALICGELFFTKGFVRLYLIAFIVLILLAAIFYILNA